MVPRHDGDYHINDEVIQACEETADDQLGQGADPVPSIGAEYLKVMTSHFIIWKCQFCKTEFNNKYLYIHV